jgi:YesN/AraC family two-component response regulator
MKQAEEQKLFESLNRLLKRHPELLSDENLGRDRLAKLLGTNTTYLHSAIRKYADFTVTGYLNRLRVQKISEAMQSYSSISIEGLRVKYGFSTHTTFYRYFKREYGVSPAAFRRSVQEH